jgi:hypothetical protein
MQFFDGIIGQNEACRLFGVTAEVLKKRVDRGQLDAFTDPFYDRVRFHRVADLERLRQPVRLEPPQAPTREGAARLVTRPRRPRPIRSPSRSAAPELRQQSAGSWSVRTV